MLLILPYLHRKCFLPWLLVYSGDFFSWIVSVSGSPLPPEDNISFRKWRKGLGSVQKNHRICGLQKVKKLERDHVEHHLMLAIFGCLKDSLTIIDFSVYAILLSREIHQRASPMKGSLGHKSHLPCRPPPLWFAIWGNYLKPTSYYISSMAYY